MNRVIPIALACTALALAIAPAIGAQVQPTATIDEECVAFAFAPDGRLAYAVKRVINVRRYDMQRDDIWVLHPDGKRKRILDGSKAVQSPVPFSYAIQSLTWSPDGLRLSVDMLTTAMIDARGNTRDERMSLLLDQNGKEVKIAGGDGALPGGSEARWLNDGVTVAYLVPTGSDSLFWAVIRVRPIAGRGGRVFERHNFTAVAWNPRLHAAVAIERDEKLSEPPKLVWLDLAREERRELIELKDYLGQLTLSPSGKYISYFRDQDTMIVRETANPAVARELRVGFGPMEWAPDESRILVKRGQAKRTGDLVWIYLADGRIEPLLNLLRFRDFALSHDGKLVAVTEPGQRHLSIYPVE